MKSPRIEDDNRVRGECSGIPGCCITFFIDVWDTSEVSAHEKAMDEARKKGFKFQYVPCPDCLSATRFVEIKDCKASNCFCGQWKYKEKTALLEEERSRRRRTRMARKHRRGYI